MHRREFIIQNGKLALTLPVVPALTGSFIATPKVMNYDTHTCQIGQYRCTIFKDSMFKYLGQDFFLNAPEQEILKELDRYHQTPDNIPSPFVALLLTHGQEKILVDTGVGFAKEPLEFKGHTYQFQGRLIDILEQEKINKKEITQVILTHFHPDHIGGIYNEVGQLFFPNATFWVHEAEWNYWHSSQSDQQPPLFGYFIEKNVSKLKNQDLRLIKGQEQEILPGITAIQIPGHTPGQIAIRIASEPDKLLYISDAFLHPLHMEQLQWQTVYDLDHDLARASRKKLLELAYQEDMLIQAFHFDFPGLGQVDKQGDNWKWVYHKK